MLQAGLAEQDLSHPSLDGSADSDGSWFMADVRVQVDELRSGHSPEDWPGGVETFSDGGIPVITMMFCRNPLTRTEQPTHLHLVLFHI
jgi:hypothetical protein